MDTFFTYLKKTLVAAMFVIFGLVGTYIPQAGNHNNIPTAYAADATFSGQMIALVQQQWTNINTAGSWIAEKATLIQATLSAGFDKITSWAVNNLWIKEYVLDGIGWMIAKRIVSAMVDSLVTWINSGFKGSPAFVQDLQGFLLDVGDQVVGDYIQELGAVGSFICSPFRLDVQVAVSQQYQLSRVDQYASDCTLSGALGNIKSFTSGAPGSFSQNGGWDNWFDITSSPEKYTPYGSYVTAQAGANARLVNAKGEELSFLNFGGGFLSGEICSQVQGPNGTKEDCIISKPGKVIQEALSFNLDSGRQSLIVADEIDEIIGALLGQLANRVFTGAAGLLGLGSSSATSPSTYTPVAGSTGGSSNLSNLLTDMQSSLASQQTFKTDTTNYKAQLLAYAVNPTNIQDNPSKVSRATIAASDAQTIIDNTALSITTINSLISLHNSLALGDEIGKADIYSNYLHLPLYSNIDITGTEAEWDLILN